MTDELFGAEQVEPGIERHTVDSESAALPAKRTNFASSTKSHVTAVTPVQPNSDGLSSETAVDLAEVTAVTAEGADDSLSIGERDRPAFMTFDDWTAIRESASKLRPGVWSFGTKVGKNGCVSLTQQWVCSPLYVDAVTYDVQGNNYGRLLRFKTTRGHWHEWSMPMELLSADGNDLRRELLSMGALIDPDAHRLLMRFLQDRTPEKRINCALQVGWCGRSYVLPTEVIGPDAGAVIFQSGERAHDEHAQAGSIEGWQRDIAARAVGNPLLMLALSASFAGPLLAKCNGESGGIHLHGDSSTGKSTAIEAACATWGGRAFIRSWKATANGMEGAAAMCNDNLLALDEISECDPDEVGAIVYAIGNGRGKQRATRTGAARNINRWRCFVLSSGERTISTTMEEGRRRAKAGQGVRLVDVPAARRYGAWDDLHGLPSGTAFSDAIKTAASTHYGHAGRAFLRQLTSADEDQDLAGLLEHIKGLPEFNPEGAAGQVKRVAARFALIALAGELATDYGITGWPKGDAIKAAAVAFQIWRESRGEGTDERRQVLQQMSGFIDRHGDSRFSNADDGQAADAVRVNRAGWWRDDDRGRSYLFNSEGMNEALKGLDFKRALDVLIRCGALPAAGANGERSKPQRINRRVMKLYTVCASKLGEAHGC